MRRPHQPSGPLERYLHDVIGPYKILQDLRDTGSRRVLEVRDGDGAGWYAKRLHSRQHLRNEVRARAEWGDGLGERIVPLHAHSDRWLVLVTPTLRGRVGGRLSDFVEAGDFLRRFHANGPAATPVDPAWFERRLAFDLARVTPAAGDLPLDRIEAGVQRVVAAGDLDAVPVHGDFRPGNWLRVRGEGLRILDFAGSSLGPRVWDLVRLVHGPAWDRPRRLRAFTRGYAHPLAPHETDALLALLPLAALMGINFGVVRRAPLTERRSREVLAAALAPDPRATPLGPMLRALEEPARAAG